MDNETLSHEALHTLYRPKDLSQVVGQEGAVKALETLLDKGGSQAFLFSGPAGTGKTTCARIVASEMGCKIVTEIDAATNTGVDAMRSLQEGLQYVPMSGDKRAVLIDECHRLSGAAWDSLLKSVEEPPAHIVWLFCTTNAAKVPATIKTRCTHLQLKPLTDAELTALLDEIAGFEGIELPDGVADLIVKHAKGSGRQLLTSLALCRDAETKKDAASILAASLESDATGDLCRFLAKGEGSWAMAMGFLKKLEGESAEGLRIIIMNYFAAAVRNATSDKQATHFLRVLDAFSVQYNDAERDAPLMISIGRVLFAD